MKGNRKDLMDYAGMWADITDEEVNKLFEGLKEVWEKWGVNT